MKIAQIGPVWFRIPPKKIGGAEISIHLLTEGLVQKGHNVTLYASGDCLTAGKLESVFSKNITETAAGVDFNEPTFNLLNMAHAIENHPKYDLLHFHIGSKSDYAAFFLSQHISYKCLYTLRYTMPKCNEYPARYLILKKFKNLNFTSISKAQRHTSLKLHWLANIYNSLNFDVYKYNPNPEKFFLWVGAIQPTKGLHLAIQAAKHAGVKLIIAGRIEEKWPESQNYWETQVKSQVDGKQIVYVGETTRRQTAKLMGRAMGLLNPLQWDEAFGNTMIESMCCGTPVIAFRRGAVPEIVRDGKTGFIVNNLQEMVQKMAQVSSIDRSQCRLHVEKKFPMDKMITSYEKVYQSIVSK